MGPLCPGRALQTWGPSNLSVPHLAGYPGLPNVLGVPVQEFSEGADNEPEVVSGCSGEDNELPIVGDGVTTSVGVPAFSSVLPMRLQVPV